MKYFSVCMAIALSCLFSFSGGATAATANDWNGCYAGINGGAGFAHNRGTVLRDVLLAIPFNQPIGGATAGGYIVGGQAGCDRQISDWVFGAQAMLDFAHLRGNHAYIGATPTDLIRYRVNGFGTVTGRVGKLLNPGLLPYLSAGAAWTLTNYNDTETSLPFGPYVGKNARDRFGALIGFGVEQRLQGNWSLFAEYDYMYFGDKNVRLDYSDGPVFDFKFRQTMSDVKIGLNYRF